MVEQAMQFLSRLIISLLMMQQLLEMPQLNHIVCFDMAQIQGDQRVGASVCFKYGRPNKNEYRKYTFWGGP